METKTEIIRRWQELKAQLAIFERQNEKVISEWERDMQEVKTAKILQTFKMVGLVWCRNGNITPDAVLCKLLSCPFKTLKSDTINGPVKCQRFRFTNQDPDWNTARDLIQNFP